jgi:hypothetical protein
MTAKVQKGAWPPMQLMIADVEHVQLLGINQQPMKA